MKRLLMVVLGLACAQDVWGAEPSPDPNPDVLKAAARRALANVKRGTAGYIEQRDCFSCHHQAMGVLSLQMARRRGFDDIDPDAIEEQVDFTETALKTAEDAYRAGRGEPGGTTRAGYSLWTLEVGGRGAETGGITEAMVEFLLQRDSKYAFWKTSSSRPPTEASPITSTYVAIRGLKAFATPAQRDRAKARIEKAQDWLTEVRAKDTEDRVFRLRGLVMAGAKSEAIAGAVKDLVSTQRPDGGWSQLDGDDKESDAYATGSALVALHETGGMSTDDPIYRHGLAFLLKTQRDDGTWYVKSRSKPFQTYFESGFPHGPDQFISMAATSWATMAILSAIR